MAAEDFKKLGDRVCAALCVARGKRLVPASDGGVRVAEEYPPVSESDGACVEVLVPALRAAGYHPQLLSQDDMSWSVELIGHPTLDNPYPPPGESGGPTLREALIMATADALGMLTGGEQFGRQPVKHG